MHNAPRQWASDQAKIAFKQTWRRGQFPYRKLPVFLAFHVKGADINSSLELRAGVGSWWELGARGSRGAWPLGDAYVLICIDLGEASGFGKRLRPCALFQTRLCSSAHTRGCAGRRGAEGGGGDDARPPRAAGMTHAGAGAGPCGGLRRTRRAAAQRGPRGRRGAPSVRTPRRGGGLPPRSPPPAPTARAASRTRRPRA